MSEWFNPATLAIALIIATGCAALFVAHYRDVIWVDAAPPRARQRPRRIAPRPVAGPKPTPKQAEAVSAPVSGIATPESDPETIAFRVLAKLVKAGHITQTDALCTAFDVRAGSSKAYTAVLEKYKAAAAELDKMEANSDAEATKPQ